MKKYLLLLIFILLVSGCTQKKENVTLDKEKDKETENIPEPVDEYTDDNPITLGLYMNGKLVKEYNTKFTNGVDIASFDVYFTNEENVGSSNTKYNFNKYYHNYENIDKYKIGYFVSFEANGKHYEKVITDPDVEFALTPYVYLYLYDDINQADGAWYSHVTKDEYNDATILSSIKLYMAEKADEMESSITLTAFTYDGEEDFDKDGYYRGNSVYTIMINNQ